ncbi:LOW QUALITY PROTEIN: palmdelphin-like [Neosynchiropus ocellatus]
MSHNPDVCSMLSERLASLYRSFLSPVSSDVSPPDPVPRPDIPTISQPAPAAHPTRLPDTEGSKKATFAVEIQVEHDKRTGKSQVVSTAAVTAEALQERGLKVYEDGRKCIYAVNTHKSDVGEMTRGEAEELLLKATDKDVPTDVQYHQPVYSTAYNGNSRPSTPRSPGLTPKLRGGSRPSSQLSLILDGQRTPGATTQPKFLKPKDTSPTPSYEEDIPMHLEDEKHSSPKPCSHHLDEEHVEEHLNSQVESQAQPAVVAVKVRSEEVSMPIQSIYRDTDSRGQTPDHEAWMQMDSLAAELESGPVTMIFMGYERAEEEEEGFQAELVVIDGSDDDHNEEGEEQETSEDLDDSLSYHPEGYKSQVFKPTVSVAQVSGSGEIVDGDPPLQNSLGIHKPTFTHKSRKQNLPRRGVDGSESKGGLNMEKMKLSSTER